MKTAAAIIGIVFGASGAVWATRIPARAPVAGAGQVGRAAAAAANALPGAVVGQGDWAGYPPPVAPMGLPEWEIWVKTPNTDFTRYTRATLPKIPGWGVPGYCSPVRLGDGSEVLAWYTSDDSIDPNVLAVRRVQAAAHYAAWEQEVRRMNRGGQ